MDTRQIDSAIQLQRQSISCLLTFVLLKVFEIMLDLMWYVNLTGVVMRPLVHITGETGLFKAVYQTPISTLKHLVGFLKLSSFWTSIIMNEKLLIFSILILLYLFLKRIMTFTDNGVLVRWRRTTILLSVTP